MRELKVLAVQIISLPVCLWLWDNHGKELSARAVGCLLSIQLSSDCDRSPIEINLILMFVILLINLWLTVLLLRRKASRGNLSKKEPPSPGSFFTQHQTLKKCVACAEEIQKEALLCRFCGTRQDDASFPGAN
jgi:hypothetical protein